MEKLRSPLSLYPKELLFLLLLGADLVEDVAYDVLPGPPHVAAVAARGLVQASWRGKKMRQVFRGKMRQF